MTQTDDKKVHGKNTAKLKKTQSDKPETNSSQDKQVEELQNKISDLEKVVNDLNDKLLRALAESDNLRRRSQEELEKANKYAISNFASELVVVMENFYLSVDNMPKEDIEKNANIKNFADGIVMTKKELGKIFEKNGIKRLYPIKEKFDHNYHQAISQIESDEPDGIVLQVIQAGYLIKDRLIRPALVAVSKAKS